MNDGYVDIFNQVLNKVAKRKLIEKFNKSNWQINIFFGQSSVENNSLEYIAHGVGDTDVCQLPYVAMDETMLCIQIENLAYILWRDKTKEGLIKKINCSFLKGEKAND